MKIDKEKCIGCGVCESNYPGVFKIEDGKATVKDKTIKSSDEYIDVCPVRAIEE